MTIPQSVVLPRLKATLPPAYQLPISVWSATSPSSLMGPWTQSNNLLIEDPVVSANVFFALGSW
jgi:hypothetical protein